MRSGFRKGVLRGLCWSALGCLLLSGCSATVQLRHDPLPIVSKFPNKKVVVVQFANGVPEDNRVGRAKNFFGMTVRWVTLKPSVAVVLSETVTDAMNRSGMDAELVQDAQAPDGTFILTGQLKDMMLKSHPGLTEVKMDAMILFDAQVRRPDGRVVALGQFEGRVEPTSVGGMDVTLDQSFEQAMRGAIQDGARKLFTKLRSDSVFGD